MNAAKGKIRMIPATDFVRIAKPVAKPVNTAHFIVRSLSHLKSAQIDITDNATIIGSGISTRVA